MPSDSPELMRLEKAEDWIQFRMPEIQRILDSMRDVKHEVVGDDMINLNRFHTISSVVRERQQYVKTYLVQVINMQLEVRRFLSLAKQKYKDAMGKAFDSYSTVIAQARSYEEKEIRLRKFVPEISEKEQWEEIVEQIASLKEAVQLTYDDLSKSAMAVTLQNNVVKNQIMTGELQLRVGNFTAQGIIQENLFDKKEQKLLNPLPGDGHSSGEFELKI
jgi:hypothetical protein